MGILDDCAGCKGAEQDPDGDTCRHCLDEKARERKAWDECLHVAPDVCNCAKCRSAREVKK